MPTRNRVEPATRKMSNTASRCLGFVNRSRSAVAESVRQRIENHRQQFRLKRRVLRARSHLVLARMFHGFHRGLGSIARADRFGDMIRELARAEADLPPANEEADTVAILSAELRHLQQHAERYAPHFRRIRAKRVLFAGQCYYNSWYLSRGLRALDWRADVLNWDQNPASQIYYHGEDVHFAPSSPYDELRDLSFYASALFRYDVFHFANAHGMTFGFYLQSAMNRDGAAYGDVELVRRLGKKIVYSNNGCQDGVSQTAFSKWGPESVCAICIWRNRPDVCSDARNLEWGAARNRLADFQCLLGGNRADFNAAPTVHEVPQFYCLDTQFWRPDLDVPEKWRLPQLAEGGVRLYHAVGNRSERTDETGVNIKSSHIYLPLIEKLKAEGTAIDLIHPTGVPNRDVRFLQVQADIFLDMLTYGWFGANAREAMMLGKPVICFIRPEWLADLRREVPGYADELPIVSATPSTIEAVLRDLIANPQKRAEIGRRSREFAIKWHSKEAGATRFDDIYARLLADDPQLLERYA